MALKVDTSNEISTRAGPVHLSTAGRGDRSLLVITPIGDAWMTAAMPAGLQDLFTIRLMELPGTGRSSLNAGVRPSVPTITGAIEDVVATLDDSPILLGHSMNGTLALAAAGSSTCTAVVAVTPPPRLPPDPACSTAYWDLKADNDRRRRGRQLVAAYEATTDPAERESLQEEFDRLRRWYDQDFDPTEIDGLAEVDLDWVRTVFEGGRDLDWTNAMKAIDRPVLLALGEFDFIAPPSAWTEDITPPKATTHLFRRSGHTPFLEQPDEFLEVTERWLSGSAR